MSYLTYLLAGWVFMHNIWPGRRAHWVQYETVNNSNLDGVCHLLPFAKVGQYTPYISRGFYFREFRESGAIHEFINTRKYLPPIPTHECDLCTQYIALLDREFNHSRKCLKVPIREKLDSRNIWRIQYTHNTQHWCHVHSACWLHAYNFQIFIIIPRAEVKRLTDQ